MTATGGEEHGRVTYGMNFEELDEYLNASADQDLGTVVSVLDGEGRFDEASTLELCRLSYDAVRDNWTPQQVKASLLVDPLYRGQITDEIVETVARVVEDLLGDDFRLVGLAVRPMRVPAGWREGRAQARLADVGPANQATYRTMPEHAPSRGRLRFGSEEEARVYDALVVVQERRPAEATVGIMPGCAFRAVGRTFWPDFVVTHRGRAAGLEVDGPHHHGRAAADQSRDRLLENAGLLFVDRLVVEDTADAGELERWLEGFLARMLTR